MAEGQYTSQERVYVDKDGNRVDAKDTARHRLLVAAGGSIPMEDARKAGLLNEEGKQGEADSEAANSDDASDTGAIDAQEESARIQGKAAKKGAKKR
jgi:hypothetical protein